MLGDNSSVGDFIASEMTYGLAAAVEAKIVADVLATNGVQLQPFATDLFATTRGAITDIQTLGVAPAFWIINPLDWADIELIKNAAVDYMINKAGPVDVAAQRLWSTPVVVPTSVPAGTGYLYGKDAVELSTDGVVALRWAESGHRLRHEHDPRGARVDNRPASYGPGAWSRSTSRTGP